jgi:RNA polymerase sigma factor (sigma-70 family)
MGKDQTLMKNDPPNSPSDDGSKAPGTPPMAELPRDGVAELFKNKHKALVTYLRVHFRLVADEAKEVAQEAYVRMLARKRQKTIRSMEGFLFRTAANLAINKIKKAQGHDRLNVQVGFQTQHESRSPEPSLLARQEWELIDKAMKEQLPEKMRLALHFRLKGMSIDEVAAALDLHPRKVRRDVAEATEFCRKILAECDLEQGKKK